MTSQLTRHLYRVDEVRASLLWGILRSRCTEVAFWATELLETGLLEELRATLHLAWAYGIGCRGLRWLGGLEPTVLTAVGLARSLKDSSLIAILTLSPQPDRVGPIILPAVARTWTAEQQFVGRAVIQGKVPIVWDWMARQEGAVGVMEAVTFLSHLMELKHQSRGKELIEALEKLVLTDAEKKGIVCAMLCMTHVAFEESLKCPVFMELPKEVAEALTDWAALEGPQRRVFPVQIYALHGATERGALFTTQSTDVELRRLRALEAAMARCPFWTAAVETAQASDDGREEFYDCWFPYPTDIPDEWSAAARSKSHGPGAIPPGATSWTLGRWIRSWFERIPCSLIWDGVRAAATRVDAEYEWDMHSNAWDAFREGLGETGVITWTFAPAMKIVRAATAS